MVTVIYVRKNAILWNKSEQNRSIPKLNYNFIKKLNKISQITFILNGGIDSLELAENLNKDYEVYDRKTNTK